MTKTGDAVRTALDGSGLDLSAARLAAKQPAGGGALCSRPLEDLRAGAVMRKKSAGP